MVMYAYKSNIIILKGGTVMSSFLKRCLSLMLVTIMLVSMIPYSPSVGAASLGDFYMEAADNPTMDYDLACYKESDSSYYLFLQKDTDITDLKIRTTLSVRKITGATYDKSTGIISCSAYEGYSFVVNYTKKVTIMQSSLPAVNIDIDSGYSLDTIHADKEAKIKAHASIDCTENGEYDVPSSPIELKTRGNTTFNYIKKPYQMKFDSKVDLFGMGKEKKWILLANYVDGTMVRNKVIFDLGEEIGMPYTCQSVFVDLYINNQYMGVYQLTEKVEAGNNRVPLKDDYATLLEMEGNNRPFIEEIFFITWISEKVFLYKDYALDFENTEDYENLLYVNKVKDNVEQKVFDLEEELYSETPDWERIQTLIDVDSFIDYFFIIEYSMQVDACYSSTYLYQMDKDDVLHCGPLWDFDRCWGVGVGYDQSSDCEFLKNIKDSTDDWRLDWYTQLFRIPEFVERVHEVYDEKIRAAFDSDKLLEKIDAYQEMLMPSLRMNHVKFVVFYNINYTVEELIGEDESVDSRVDYATDYMKNSLVNRKAYLDTVYGKYTPVIQYNVSSEAVPSEKIYTGGVATQEIIKGYASDAETQYINSFSVELPDGEIDGGVEYGFVSYPSRSDTFADGEVAAAPAGKAIQSIKVNLTGNVANYYTVKYRVYSNGAWSSWKADGSYAGSGGNADRYNATRIQIKVVRKSDILLGNVNLQVPVNGTSETVTSVVGNAYTPSTVKKLGYTFDGWYDNPEFAGDEITSVNVTEDGSTLYAKLVENPPMVGDTNGDGRLSSIDLACFKKYISGTLDDSDIVFQNADANGDGRIRSNDLIIIKRTLAGEL